jgi:hypothetical protein
MGVKPGGTDGYASVKDVVVGKLEGLISSTGSA